MGTAQTPDASGFYRTALDAKKARERGPLQFEPPGLDALG